MDNIRDSINKVLDRAQNDIDPSEKEKFKNAFIAFIRSQGIAFDDGKYITS